MSDLLDERVVEMRFDNANFEKNVNQSIKTIDKLKESLDFENAGDSFESISNAAAKCDMKPLEESLEGITVKFNMLEMVAANVLGNITSKIVDAGARLAKSLTTDQLTAGWQKYNQKTEAVQTIMSATGESIDVINQKLEKLIWFADETSYDFVDMVNNIGKFTSAGVDLDTAVDSMMGISNWAAASGAGIQQASRAMYNLSQSIGMGYVGLTDWKSIELANMATKEFKETAIETAVALGELKQEADGTVKTLDGKVTVTAENMRESLKKQWLTKDVLNETLAAYNEFANAVHDRQEQWAEENNGAYLTVSRTIKLLEKEGYDMDSLGAKAFQRAQEATKFSEAVAATADAVSSGWMNTFELIFGNYEQAKRLWTDLANDMYDVFASGNERRNEKLSDLMHSNYQKMLDEMPDGEDMNNRLYEKLYESTKASLGEDRADELFSAYSSLEDMLKDRNNLFYGSTLAKAFQDVSDDYAREAQTAANLSKQLKSGSLTLKQAALRLATGQYGMEIEAQKKAVEELGFDYESLKELAEEWKAGLDIPWDEYQKQLVEALDDQEKTYKTFVKTISDMGERNNFFKGLTELGGRDKLIGGFQNIIDTFKNAYLTVIEVKNGIEDLSGAGSFLEGIIDGFYNLTEAFAFTDEKFEEIQENIQNFFSGGLQRKWNEFLYGKSVHMGTIWSDELNSYIPLYEHIPGLVDHVTRIYEDHLKVLPPEVKKTIETIKTNVFGFFTSIPEEITRLKEKIFGKLKKTNSINVLTGERKEIIEYTGGLINDFKDKIRGLGNGLGGKIFDGFIKALTKISDFLFGFEKNGTFVEGAFVKIYDKAMAFWQKLKDIGKSVTEIIDKFKNWLGLDFHEIGIFNPETGKIESKFIRIHGAIDNIKKIIENLVNSKAYQSVHEFLFGKKSADGTVIKNNIFGKVETAINKVTSSKAYQSIHDFIFGKKSEDGTVIKNNIFGKIGTAIEILTGSKAYQSIYDFIFGKKSDDGTIIKNNIFGKIGTAINMVISSSAYKSIHDFLFGNEESGAINLFERIGNIISSIGNSAPFKAIHDLLFGNDTSTKGTLGALPEQGNKILNVFEKIKKTIESIKEKINNWKTIWLTGFNKETFSWELGENIEHVDGKFKQFFINVKNGFNSLLQNAGYESIHEFIFGSKIHGIDNIVIRFIDAIKKKFNELKAAHPWLQSMCDFINDSIDKIKNKLGISGNGLSSVLETVSNVFSRVWKSVISFKDNLFKKDQKSIFERLWEFITGPAKFIKNINKTARIICQALIGLSVILLATSIRIGGIEISSPFESLAGTVKDFAISVALIAASIVGVAALVTKLNISEHAIAQTTLLIAAIMATLVGCAKILEGDDHKLNLADILKLQINTIPTLRALSTIILEIAAIAAVFALMARFIGKNAVLAGAGAIAIVLAGIGVCLALLHAPELFRGAKDVKSRGGELIGLAFALSALSGLLITLGLLIAEFSVISKSMEGSSLGTHARVFVGILGIMAFVVILLNRLKSLSEKGISAGTVVSLGLVTLLIRELGSVISTLTNLSKKVGGWEIFDAWATLGTSLAIIYMMIDKLSKLKVDLSIALTLGIVGYVINTLGSVLEKVANVVKKVGAGNSFLALIEVVLSLAAVLGAITWLSHIDIDMKTVMNFAIMAGIITVLGGIVLGFTKLSDMLGVKFDPKQVLNMILSIGEVVLAIAGLSIIFGAIGKVAKELNSGFGAVAGLIVKTAGIVALVVFLAGVIGGIAQVIDNKLAKKEGASLDAINYFGDLLESVFNGLGKAVSAVIGGFGEGITDSLPAIGKNISDFVDKLSGFIDKVGGLKEEHLAGAGILTGILLAIAADTVITNITALAGLFGTVSAYIIGTNMSSLLEKLQPFLTGVSELNESHVKGAGYFTRLLIKIGAQTVIAAFAGIAGMFATASPYTVGTNISNLITKLEPFLSVILTLSEQHVKGVGYFTKILKAIGAQMLIAGLDNLISVFGGSRNFNKMFTTLNTEIAPEFKKFANLMASVSIGNAEKAAKILPEIMNMLTDSRYKTGGISGVFDWLINGDAPDYKAVFSTLNEDILPGLVKFANGVNSLNDAGEKVDYSNIATAAEAIRAVMEIMNMDTSNLVSDEKKGWWIFKEDQSGADRISESFDAINSKVVPAIKNLQSALKSGETEVDSDYIRDTIGAFSGLIQTLMEFQDFGLDPDKVSEIGSYIITGLVEALDAGTQLVKEAAQRVAAGITEGLTLTLEIHSPSKVAYEIGQFVAAGLTEGLRAGEGMTWSMARAFGQGTIEALSDGLANSDAVTQHAINMVTMDLLDENRFDMPDFTFKNRFGNDDIDFDKMQKFLMQKFGNVFDQDQIRNFIGSYRQAMKEVDQTINDETYNTLMADIAKGDYGFGHDAIIESLTKELGTVKAANQAWEDYTDVLAGNLKINQDLLKQKKQNPPMTEEQWMAMLAWDQEGIDKHNRDEFRKLAAQNGTTWQEEAAKQGYDPKRIQEFYNKQWQTSEQYYDLYIKQKAENEILEEQTELVDEVIRANEQQTETIEKQTEAVDELNKAFDVDVHDPVNDIYDNKDAEVLTEVAEAAKEAADAEKDLATQSTAKAEALEEDAEAATKAAEATETATVAAGKYADQVDYKVWASGLQKVMKGTDDLTEAEKKMFEIGRQAIYEGAYGKNNDNRTWENALISQGLTKAEAEAAAQYATYGKAFEDYHYVAGVYGKDINNVTDSTKESSEAAKEASSFLNSLQDDTLKAYGQLYKYAMASEDSFKDFKVDINYDTALKNAKEAGDESAVALIESLSDKAEDIGFKLDLADLVKEGGIKDVGEFIGKGLNEVVAENLLKGILPTDSAGNFGFLSEMLGKFNLSMDDVYTGLSKGTQLLGKNSFVGGLLNGIFKFEDEVKEVNETEIKPEANTSSIESAISMADQLKAKYTLDNNEIDIVKKGAQNLQNGVALTEKQANLLQKVWDGVMIGMYDSGDKRIQQLMQLFDIDWDTLASFSDGFGNLDLSTATSSAQEFAQSIIDMRDAGKSYSTADLFKDIQEGKWGVGQDRIKALEKAGYDVEKVQEKFLEWHNGDGSIADLPEDYLRISEAEQEANKQAEKMNAVLNQTPEGAFRSVADFLDGVNKAVENKETADKFKQLMTDIADSMKSLSLSDASNFEKVAGFLTAVRTSAKESSVIAQDFKAFVDGIKDSVTQLGDIDIKNPEGMDKVKDFLNNIKIENKDTLEAVSNFIGNIVEFATGANAGGDYSTKLTESIDALMTSINGIRLDPTVTTPVVGFLNKLISASDKMSESDPGMIQQFITNLYDSLTNSSPLAASAAEVIANVIIDTLKKKNKDMMAIGEDFVKNIEGGMLRAKPHAISGASSIAGAIMNTIKDQAINKVSQSGADFVSNLVTSLNSPESQEKIKNALDNLFNPKEEPAEEYDTNDILNEKLAIKNRPEVSEQNVSEGPSAGTQYGQQFVQDVSAAIQNGVGEVSEAVSGFGEAVSASITIDAAGVAEQAGNFVANLASGLLAGLEGNREALEKVMGEINGIITSGVPDGHAVGFNYMKGIYEGLLEGAETFGLGGFLPAGLAKGMEAGASKVTQAGEKLGKAAEEGVRTVTKTESPSKVFMAIGGYLVEGLAIGIEENTRLAKESTENMGNTIFSMFSAVVSNISDIASEEMNLDPVIRPVIDMSDVYDSASKIDAALSTDKAMSISTAESAKNAAQEDVSNIPQTPGSQTFIQNNYSPKALTRLEIYRQTRNQFAMIKGVNQTA